MKIAFIGAGKVGAEERTTARRVSAPHSVFEFAAIAHGFNPARR
jgi:hypothetical protein